MVKKFSQYIKESNIEEINSSNFDEISNEVKDMIEKTIENSGGEFSTFLDSILKNPEDVKIEGFINDSDIYDFYLKWRNEIDEILNNIKFFSEIPTDINAFGLYEYVIKGTERSMMEIIKMLN